MFFFKKSIHSIVLIWTQNDSFMIDLESVYTPNEISFISNQYRYWCYYKIFQFTAQ